MEIPERVMIVKYIPTTTDREYRIAAAVEATLDHLVDHGLLHSANAETVLTEVVFERQHP